MRCRLFSLMCALSLVLCVLTLIWTVRSYSHWFRLDYLARKGAVEAITERGRIMFERWTADYENRGLDWNGGNWTDDSTERDDGTFNHFGIHAGKFNTPTTGDYYWLSAPFWWLPILFALPPMTYFLRRVNSRQGTNYCRTCGYDLRATPIVARNAARRRCPERLASSLNQYPQGRCDEINRLRRYKWRNAPPTISDSRHRTRFLRLCNHCQRRSAAVGFGASGSHAGAGVHCARAADPAHERR
jgi:hypothetical protein